MNDVNEYAVLNIAKANRQAALDFMQFTRLPQVKRIKYEDGFTPPYDHNEWVERQVIRGRSGKPTSVRGTIRDSIEELTEEYALFNKLDKEVPDTIISTNTLADQIKI